MLVGMPPLHLIQTCSRRRRLFTQNNSVVRSRFPSTVVESSLKEALCGESDPEFLHFIEVSKVALILCIVLSQNGPIKETHPRKRTETPLD